MEELSERAKRNKEQRVNRKRQRESDAHERRVTNTLRQVREILAKLESTEEPVLWSTVDMTWEALEFFRTFYHVTPAFAEDDDDTHSLWRID